MELPKKIHHTSITDRRPCRYVHNNVRSKSYAYYLKAILTTLQIYFFILLQMVSSAGGRARGWRRRHAAIYPVAEQPAHVSIAGNGVRKGASTFVISGTADPPPFTGVARWGDWATKGAIFYAYLPAGQRARCERPQISCSAIAGL